MSIPSVTINLVIYNGEKYIRLCLDSVLAQSYPHENIEINILDNASTDSTLKIIKNLEFGIWNLEFAKFFFLESKKNLGMWPGQEKLLEHSHGEYIVVLSVDVILHPDFVKNVIGIMEQDEEIGALQGKIIQYKLKDGNQELSDEKTNIIDTLGFDIYKPRRIVNVGHGESASAKGYGETREIFAVEGAVPVFRRQALEDCRLKSQGDKIVDPDFFWYGDDLDLAWRMRVFGWKQVYSPVVIAWHDRKTTKALAGGWQQFIKIRRDVPMFKRRLDWRNTTFAIIKNDFTSNYFRDLPQILWRQLRLWVYFVFCEPTMILEIFNVARLLPKMLKRRREIMKKAKISPKGFRRWIH